MTRHHFQINKPYAAKLIRVATRPIENDPNVPLQLIRLEFAIYWMAEGRKLESQGEIACRDLVVGKLIPIHKDSGLNAYADALGIAHGITDTRSWIALEVVGAWIELEFGPPEVVGGRNPFYRIAAFDPKGWSIEEYRYDLTKEWVRPGVAADALKVSESTIRRRVGVFVKEFGSRLVRRTEGNQRRIHLPLLLNLWED
ncbi:hypothetical protein Q31b_37570 [Novipirellula aureliae]|uniref:Uncharacterized protein n=1 Tax=Novipirellula aureliae TaxID=2527966 RepID=A0A5C6DV63_9BACT|nr:hypothetical protein [Novipirellula aureliae]TWU38679.1 hypothetical protein Q31b_37570 [Novipirellula aureliae]